MDSATAAGNTSIVQQARVKTTPGARSAQSRSDRLRAQVLSPDRHIAAFDLENTLIASNVVASYSWLATRRLGRDDRARFVVKQMLEGPSLLKLDRLDRSDFLRFFYRRYEGAPVDQIEEDAAEMFSDLILAKSFPAAIRRVREHRSLGHRTVLITGALDFVVKPLAPLFDDIVAARMGTTVDVRHGRNYDGRLTYVPPTGEARYQALVDYADAIELNSDKKQIGSHVFVRMAGAYAALGQFCEAATPLNMWVALDVANRDTNRTQRMIDDYETRGNCVSSKQFQKERFPVRGQQNVVTVKAEINGVRGVFILDTGASYLSVKSAFADRAKIPQSDAMSEITLMTANGQAKAKLSKADKVMLGKLEAVNVPVAIQKVDEKSYGAGVDGLLGMSFLSRFEVQMANGTIEVRTRRPKR